MGEISKVIDKQVPPQVEKVINDQIISTDGFASLGIENLALDFQIPVDPRITDTNIELFMNATIFDATKGYKVPNTPITALDIDLSQHNQMMVDASTYSVDSLLSVLQEQNWFSFLFTPDTFGGIAKGYLSTTYLDGILPGLITKYGKDTPVSVNFISQLAPNSFFNVDEVGAKMHARIEFIINNEIAVALQVNDADALVSPSLNDFILKIQVIKFALKVITVTETKIGTIDGDEIKVFLNVLFRLGIPVANSFLNGGFRLPNEYFGFMVVKAAEFQAKSGYVQIGFVPEFF